MASTINAKTTGVGGIDASGDASGVLALQTGGTTAVTIDASQNVGIGTSSPNGILSVSQNTNAQSWLTLRNTNSGSSASSGVLFGNDANAAYGALYVNSSTNTGFGGANSINLGSYGAYPLTFITSSTERMRIDSSGRVLINASAIIGSDTAPLQVSGGTVTAVAIKGGSNSYFQAFYNTSNSLIGSITGSTGTTTSYNTTSDQRLKENIVDAPSALASVNAIKVRSFDWKSSGEHQEYGYIAQELLEVAPEAVHVPTDEDQMMGVDFGKLTPRLVKAIQELKAIIDTQNARIEALEAK